MSAVVSPVNLLHTDVQWHTLAGREMTHWVTTTILVWLAPCSYCLLMKELAQILAKPWRTQVSAVHEWPCLSQPDSLSSDCDSAFLRPCNGVQKAVKYWPIRSAKWSACLRARPTACARKRCVVVAQPHVHARTVTRHPTTIFVVTVGNFFSLDTGIIICHNSSARYWQIAARWFMWL